MLIAPVSLKDPNTVLRFFASIAETVNRILNPQGGVKFYACLQADLPAASDQYANRTLIVSDLQTLAICTFNGSAWEWTRADGSAL